MKYLTNREKGKCLRDGDILIDEERRELSTVKARALVKTVFQSEKSCRIMLRTLIAFDWLQFKSQSPLVFAMPTRMLAMQFCAYEAVKKKKGKA